VQTLSAQLGWSHHQVLLDACGDKPDLYAWYAAKAVEPRWTVRHLKGQIDLRLHERQGTNWLLARGPHRLASSVCGRICASALSR
jgi:hypothetical protein